MPLPAGQETEYIEERDREMNERHLETCTYLGCVLCHMLRRQRDVDALYEKHKDDPGFDRAMEQLEKAGMLRPIVVCPPPGEPK